MQQETLNVGRPGHTFDSEYNFQWPRALENEGGKPLEPRQDRNHGVKKRPVPEISM